MAPERHKLLLALRKLAEETATRANLHLDLALPEYAPALFPDVEQCLYRVVQEATANVAHHANAQTLEVTLTVQENQLVLTVTDDGIGFRPNPTQDDGHFGLSGMRERARLVGGHLTLDSGPGQGTMVRLTIEV